MLLYKYKMPKKIKKKKHPCLLVVMDGWGYGEAWGGNAITVADTPNFDDLWNNFPHTLLKASGEAVGVSAAETGSSEVGHMNIGAGYIVKQQLPLINESIKSKKFFSNNVLLQTLEQSRRNNSNIHILGLLSDGGVHSHIDHLLALLDFYIEKKEAQKIFIHCFTDGRDTDIHSAQKYLGQIQEKITNHSNIQIASICGRYYAMDRDKHWDRTEKAYKLLVEEMGNIAQNPEEAVLNSYAKGVTDEFIQPTIIKKCFKPICESDIVVVINYRADRMRQLMSALIKKDFNSFHVKKINNLFVAGFIKYADDLEMEPIFPTVTVANPLAKIISDNNLTQLHIAETEKYAHVTYFFNGGQELAFAGEDHIMIPSPKVATYDLAPEMSAEKITKEVIRQFKIKKYNFIIINYANADMVGHTGNFDATVKAVETIDHELKALRDFFIGKENFTMLITADHGNAEVKIDSETGGIGTEHTENPVPFLYIAKDNKNIKLKQNCSLSSIAPTILKIMHLSKPKSMTSPNLIA